MSSKLSRVRLKNLLDRLQAAYDSAERANLDANDDVRALGHEAMESIEITMMSIGSCLADDEDGTKPL